MKLYDSMEGLMDEIKFYGKNEETMRIPKEIIASASNSSSAYFNEALKCVAKKDIDTLNIKIKKMISEIVKKLVVAGVVLEDEIQYDVSSIDELIDFVETHISNFIIEKGSIKIGLFTSNKKEKRQKIAVLENIISYLNKCQEEFIIIKKEYDKLNKRDLKLDDVSFASEISEELEKEDPLERTINFYLRKQEKGN